MQNFELHIFNFWTPHFSVWTWPRLPPAPLPPPPTVTGEVADNHTRACQNSEVYEFITGMWMSLIITASSSSSSSSLWSV